MLKHRKTPGKIVKGAKRDAAPCGICKHPDRAAIEKAVLDEIIPLNTIGIQWSVSLVTLRTHRRSCMPKLNPNLRIELEKVIARPLEGLEGNPFTDRVRLVEQAALGMLKECEEKKDMRNFSAIAGQLLRCAELIGKQRGDLVDRRETNTVHHGGVVVLGVPAVATGQQRRVIAAPRDGDRVSAAVAQADHTLVELEAEIVGETAETPENGPSGEKNTL